MRDVRMRRISSQRLLYALRTLQAYSGIIQSSIIIYKSIFYIVIYHGELDNYVTSHAQSTSPNTLVSVWTWPLYTASTIRLKGINVNQSLVFKDDLNCAPIIIAKPHSALNTLNKVQAFIYSCILQGARSSTHSISFTDQRLVMA